MLKFVNMELGDPETLAAVLVSQVPSGGHGRSKALRKAVFPKWFVLFCFFFFFFFFFATLHGLQDLSSPTRD